MKLAGDFLAKFQRLTPPNDAIKKVVVEAVRSVVGVPLEKKDVSLTNGIVFVRCSSIAKSAIRLQRSGILEEIHTTLPKAKSLVRDIR